MNQEGDDAVRDKMKGARTYCVETQESINPSMSPAISTMADLGYSPIRQSPILRLSGYSLLCLEGEGITSFVNSCCRDTVVCFVFLG